MKIKFIITLLCIMMFSGCSATAASTSQAPTQNGGKTQGSQGMQGGDKPNGQKGGSSTKTEIPEGGKAISGTVQSIVGNEVTILISSTETAKTTTDTDSKNRSDASTDKKTPDEANGNKERPSSRPEGAGSMPDIPTEGKGENMPTAERPSRDKTSETPNANAESLTTYLPVGMTIGTGDFSSVKAGNRIRLVYDSEDRIVAVDML